MESDKGEQRVDPLRQLWLKGQRRILQFHFTSGSADEVLQRISVSAPS